MSQSYIKQGDRVKYHRKNASLDEAGFKLGQSYEVKLGRDLDTAKIELYIVATSQLSLTRLNNGELTDVALHVTLLKPKGLPKGAVSIPSRTKV